jgi:type I restriction enzyme M protein
MSYGDYVEQLTYLLFLKMADERTKPPYNQPSAVPAKYNWPTLLKKDGDDLFDHYRHMLESLGNEKGLLGLIFNKSQNKFQDPSKLRRLVVDLIDHIRAAIAFTFLNDIRHLVATRSSPSSLNSSPSR